MEHRKYLYKNINRTREGNPGLGALMHLITKYSSTIDQNVSLMNRNSEM